MSLVKVSPKYQVTIPNPLRRKAGVAAGDVLEAKIEHGKITLTPKLRSQNEYTKEQRAVIDAQLSEALADVKAGKGLGPFDIDEAITFLQSELKPRKSKNIKRVK